MGYPLVHVSRVVARLCEGIRVAPLAPNSVLPRPFLSTPGQGGWRFMAEVAFPRRESVEDPASFSGVCLTGDLVAYSGH